MLAHARTHRSVLPRTWPLINPLCVVCADTRIQKFPSWRSIVVVRAFVAK